MAHHPLQLPPLPESEYSLAFHDEGGACVFGTGYTEDHMNAHYLKGFADGQAALSSQVPTNEGVADLSAQLSTALAQVRYLMKDQEAKHVELEKLRAALQSRQPAAPADKWSHAGYFYNAVAAEQKWLVNTNEHWCHSIKTHDNDAKATCLDCEWEGQRQQLHTQPKPSKVRKGRK